MRLFALAVVLAAPFGCFKRARPSPASQGSTVDLHWAGATKGGFAAPAEAEWCPTDSLVELSAIRGDTAFGIALVAKDTIRVGQHPIVLPSVVVDWRPLARVAFRWPTTGENKGYEANGGNVHVTDVAGNAVSGQLDVRMAAGNPRDTIRLTGTFTRVPLKPGLLPCGRTVKEAKRSKTG